MQLLIVSFVCTLVAALAAGISVQDCPDKVNRDNFLRVNGSFCFQFNVGHQREYTEAGDECRRQGGLLTMPKTQAIQDYLYHELLSFNIRGPVWIGLDDRDNEGVFMWADGTRLNDADYSFWAKDNGPRDSIIQESFDDCTALDSADRGEWHDYRCFSLPFTSDRAFPYVCQFNPVTA